MSDNNPYSAPAEAQTDLSSDTKMLGGYPVASQNRRLVNFLIDNVTVQIVSGIAGFVVGILFAISSGGVVPDSEMAKLEIIGAIVGMFAAAAYYVLMEAVFGVTIGKLVSGTRVVNEAGGSATFGQILGRSLCRMIPFEPFSFLFGDKTTGWHDAISGTRVIMTR